jgi:zinc protease
MKKQLNRFLICSPLLALAACSSSSTKTAGTAPSAKPSEGYVAPASPGSFKLKPYKEVSLANGLKIIYVQDETLPRISLTMLVKVGSLQESIPGLNAMTGFMLEQGTQSRTAIQLADEFGQVGTDIDIVPNSDFTTVYTDGLSSTSDILLTLFADVVMNPAFKDGEINRLRAQTIASLIKKVDNASSFADSRSDAFIFGDHPYGRELVGTPESLRSLRKQDFIKHYLTYYRPNNSTLAVVGSFTPEFEKKVEELFGKWTKRNVAPVKVTAAVPNETLRMKFIGKKGQQQTQIRFGELGIARNDPDYLPLRMANEILGGSFASRLNQKIRDDQGLTYSIYSSFDVRKDPGSFEINTFTKNESVGKTVDEVLKTLRQYISEGANETELDAAKMQLVGQFPRAIETADRLAYNLLALDFYGVPVTYLTHFNDNVMALKLKQVNEVSKQKIKPDSLKILIYGDNSVLPQLKAYNPEIEKLPMPVKPVPVVKPATPATSSSEPSGI